MRYIISLLLTSTAMIAAPALAEVPRVVTDIPPVHALVAEVMGDLGTPGLLLTRGANEHDFQLRPSQAQDLASADLIVWIGPDLTPWLDRAIPALAARTSTLPLLHAPQTTSLPFAEANVHDHDHGHTHDLSGTDPHAWLDPGNAREWTHLIAAELARLDPGNAAIYAANASRSAEDIADLDKRLAAQLAPIKGLPFVTQHDAYRYFVAHYGLAPMGSVAMGDASPPGAARLKALGQSLQGAGPLCLFPEAQHDPALLTQLADTAGARIGGALDPAGSLQDPGPGTYAATLQAIADTLVACLVADATTQTP